MSSSYKNRFYLQKNKNLQKKKLQVWIEATPFDCSALFHAHYILFMMKINFQKKKKKMLTQCVNVEPNVKQLPPVMLISGLKPIENA